MDDPNVSLKHIAWLVGLIVFALLAVKVIVPLIPSQSKTSPKINVTPIVLP